MGVPWRGPGGELGDPPKAFCIGRCNPHPRGLMQGDLGGWVCAWVQGRVQSQERWGLPWGTPRSCQGTPTDLPSPGTPPVALPPSCTDTHRPPHRRGGPPGLRPRLLGEAGGERWNRGAGAPKRGALPLAPPGPPASRASRAGPPKPQGSPLRRPPSPSKIPTPKAGGKGNNGGSRSRAGPAGTVAAKAAAAAATVAAEAASAPAQ